METLDIKSDINKRLQSIANILLLNSGPMTNLGLINGKMGVAIFFYQYSRYTNKAFYEGYAGTLIDEIFDQIKKWAIFDFSNGLTGIGWGIEYLVQNGFVEADADEVLEDNDKAVARSLFQNPVSLLNQTDLYSFGLYYLSRLCIKNFAEDSLITQTKKHMLVYLHDDCERILTKEKLFDFTLPKLNIKQLNSIVFFLIKMQEAQLYPIKLEKLLCYLPDYLELSADKNGNNIDKFTFLQLIEELYKNLSNSDLQKQYIEIIEELSKELANKPLDYIKEKSIEEVINIGWNSLFYKIDFSKYENLHLLITEAFSFIKNESYWFKMSQNKNNELTGLGIALLNVVNNNFYNHNS